MNPILYLSLLLLELFLLIGIATYAVGLLYSSLMGAPYVPTQKKRLREILEEAKLVHGQTFVELGSGDGRMVRLAAKEFKMKGIGVEINPLLIWWSRLLAKRQHIHNTQFIKQNVFKYDLGAADVVYLFLMPQLIVKLVAQFESQLKKGSLVISHGFKIPTWEKKMFHEIKSEPFATFYYRV